MGHFFPKLHTDYPNQYVDLHFHSYEAPFVQMKNNTMTFNSTFAIDFYIHPMKDHPKSIARFLFLFGKMFALTTSAMIKWMTKEGVPLPVFDNITISGASEIRIFEKYIRLNADLEFR
ncbi:hypothetical protein ANCDUO_09991 [Ancylostoma duodenale]|uniref:Lipid-binding serum glycoprotein C-terminal domain-containing protein n=1 Tax=Ancylostoma duodenale TaxID=51022 RepID=A0A0C2GS09_9BILA|nr:hypothetical protein ANCDUO_09991 [Ancylostoma duodenale]